jgi:hypothetical protein
MSASKRTSESGEHGHDRPDPNICKGLKFEDCELAILRMQVDKAERKVGQRLANSEDIQKIMHTVERFIKSHELVAYGGLAIDRLLPEDDKIYNKDIDIPDYDFFSPSAITHAKELGNMYVKEGYEEVEVKAGQHHGTFKVFVNFIPVADITLLPAELFKSIKRQAKKVNGMLFVDPNFLRMGMYLELSRPDGDVSRFEKVLKRLILINKHYPLHESGADCHRRDFQRSISNRYLKTREGELYDVVLGALIDKGVVFFGGYAIALYSRYMPRTLRNGLKRFPDFDVLATAPEEVAEAVKERLEDADFKGVRIIAHEALGEIVPEHWEVRVAGETVAFIYRPVACHSYNVLTMGKKKVRVATIDTMLSFYLAFLYDGRPYHDKGRILCMSKFLFDVQQKNRLQQKGLLRRFSINCYGHQETVEEMKAHKADMFRKMKDKKGTAVYDEWFLNYRPGDRKAAKAPKGSRTGVTKRGTSAPTLGKKTRRRRGRSRTKSRFFPW